MPRPMAVMGTPLLRQPVPKHDQTSARFAPLTSCCVCYLQVLPAGHLRFAAAGRATNVQCAEACGLEQAAAIHSETVIELTKGAARAQKRKKTAEIQSADKS